MPMANGLKNNYLFIFIKNPILGQVKTRLASSIGHEEALRIYKALLFHTMKTSKSVEAHKIVYYSHFLDDNDIFDSSHFEKKIQTGNDLGERMSSAFAHTFTKKEKMLIIGSDCAQITSKIIEDAFEILEKNDVVIGPTFDGGYYLLGMNQYYPQLFENIQWSTSSVFKQTIQHCETLKISYSLLPTLSDIDYIDDWKKYGWEI